LFYIYQGDQLNKGAKKKGNVQSKKKGLPRVILEQKITTVETIMERGKRGATRGRGSRGAIRPRIQSQPGYESSSSQPGYHPQMYPQSPPFFYTQQPLPQLPPNFEVFDYQYTQQPPPLV
jgi:hypothetical protein